MEQIQKADALKNCMIHMESLRGANTEGGYIDSRNCVIHIQAKLRARRRSSELEDEAPRFQDFRDFRDLRVSSIKRVNKGRFFQQNKKESWVGYQA